MSGQLPLWETQLCDRVPVRSLREFVCHCAQAQPLGDQRRVIEIAAEILHRVKCVGQIRTPSAECDFEVFLGRNDPELRKALGDHLGLAAGRVIVGHEKEPNVERRIARIDQVVAQRRAPGTRLRVQGEGEPGPNGGPTGDLYVVLDVKEHLFFERRGADLYCTIPISIAQATLGTKISVRTLDGKNVAIKIPPGTPSGKRFRVRGQGIQKGDKKGDLIVEVSIQVPEKLSEEQERMMKEFAESGGMKY